MKNQTLSMDESAMSMCISIVSHGQGDLISPLLGDLERLLGNRENNINVLITLNIAEDETYLQNRDLKLSILRNTERLGFGANHNKAFKQVQADIFVVLNPDIRLSDEFSFYELVSVIEKEDGVLSPVIVDSNGNVEDNARRFPTLLSIGKRVIARLCGRKPARDYDVLQNVTYVDWLAGMFMLFSRKAFNEVNGFDTRYFMYMEDADICRRLSQAGWACKLVTTQLAVHEGQRKSHRSAKHFYWHVKSICTFIFGK